MFDPLGAPTFIHDFVWVNDGNWQSNSVEEKAITAARIAAQRAGVETYLHDVLIKRRQCDDKHLNVCSHLTVLFFKGEVTP